MNTVDCVRERMEECIEEGIEKGREEGIEKGREEGIEKGREEGREERSIEIGIKLLENGYPIDELAEMVEIPIDKLKSEYEKYKQ